VAGKTAYIQAEKLEQFLLLLTLLSDLKGLYFALYRIEREIKSDSV
jgi:hypothetical protein